MYEVTVITRDGARTRRYDDEATAVAAADRRIARLIEQDGMQRTGGRPIVGAIVTAHLRATDRRRTATAKVLVEVSR